MRQCHADLHAHNILNQYLGGGLELGVNWPPALLILSRRFLFRSFERRSSRQVSFKIGCLDMGAALKAVVCDGRATNLANQPCSQLGSPNTVPVAGTKGCAQISAPYGSYARH